jgi:putative aldouronate transport system substrate-binding protein
MAKRIVAVLLVIGMVIGLCACGSSSKSNSSSATLTWTKAADVSGDDAEAGKTDSRAFQKFDSTVEVHIGTQIDSTDKTLPAGDDAGNNEYTRYLLDTFNIKTVVDWSAGSAADYNNKVSLQIAAGDLPNALVVTNRSYMVKAASAGLLADIHDSFDKYASKQIKQIMETTNGRAYNNGTYKGSFVGLPNVSVETDGIYVYFIRQDWLDKLNLTAPKTSSELEEVAKKFMEAGLSPKYAIAGKGNSGRTYATFLESGNNGLGFDAVYQSQDAWPGYFLSDGNGGYTYGTLSDNTKSSLEILAKWYKEGLINPELGTSPSGEEMNEVKAGTCGIFMGPWWELGYGNGDSFKNDATADWQAYPLYTDDGKWNVKIKDCGSSYTIVSKTASDDVKKAVMIMNNSLVRDESIMDTSVAIGWWPLRNTMAAMDECEHEYTELYNVLNGKTKAEDYNVPGSLYKNLYSDAQAIPQVIKSSYDPSKTLHVTDMDITTNNGEFNRFYALLIGNRCYATMKPDKKVESALYYQTETIEQYWSQLQDLEDTTVMSIITGKKDISEFDTFKQQWLSQGGQTILDDLKKQLG